MVLNRFCLVILLNRDTAYFFGISITLVDDKFTLLNLVIIIDFYENFEDHTYHGICNFWTQSRAF